MLSLRRYESDKEGILYSLSLSLSLHTHVFNDAVLHRSSPIDSKEIFHSVKCIREEEFGTAATGLISP